MRILPLFCFLWAFSALASYSDLLVSVDSLPAGVAGTPISCRLSDGSAFYNATKPTDTQPVSGTFWQTTQPVSGTFFQATQPISASSLPLPTGAAAEHTAANSPNSCRLSDGASFLATLPVSLASLPALVAGSAVIGHVIVDTAPTTAVTGPLTDTQLRATAVPVSLSALPALVGGSAVIGHVINDASSAVIGHVVADSGSTTAVTGTVTANATLSAETTKVIGTVNVASAQTIGLAAGAAVIGHVINDASSAVIGHVIADSGSTTAVTGTVTVTQATTGGNPCMNPGATLVSANGSTSGTAAVQIVALSGSTKIYLCSLTVIGVSGTTPTFSLVQGTGSNCATGQTVVVQSWTTTAGSLYAFANPVAVGTAGAELCYLNTGTTPVQRYALTYVQQ